MTARIFHADLYGTRAHKYATLLNSDIESIDWQEIVPNQPFYLFRPQEQALRAEYELGWKVTDIFPKYVLGLNSHRDHFAVSFQKEELQLRMQSFRDAKTDEECYEKFEIEDNRDWKLAKARASLQANNSWEELIVKCLYRPFDLRYCFLSEIAMDYPRLDVNRHLLMQNMSLITTRQTREPFSSLASNIICGQHKIVSVYDGSYIFPLWLYPQQGTLKVEPERRPNLSPAFVAELTAIIGAAPEPETIFYYAYAVFHAPTYRERYAPFLKIDFPRLPLPHDYNSFQALAKSGEKLVALHLLEAPELEGNSIGFPVHGDHLVKKMRVADRFLPPSLDEQNGRVRLNDREYFDNVPKEAWEFRVGGYQPAFKWLDDRAGRTLATDEITHYACMIAAMRETVALLPEVDRAFQNMLRVIA